MAKADVELAIRARDEASKALKDVRRTVKDLNDEQKDLVTAAEKAAAALSQQTRSLESVNKQLAKSQSTLAGMEGALSSEADTASRLSKEFTTLSSAVARATRDLADASAPAQQLATAYKSTTDRIGQLREQNRGLATANIEIRNSIEAATKAAKPFADAIKAAKEELRLATTAFNQSNAELGKSGTEITRAEAAYAKLEGRVGKTAERLDASRAKLAALNAELAKVAAKQGTDGTFANKTDGTRYETLARQVAAATAAVTKNEAALQKVNAAFESVGTRLSNARANYETIAAAAKSADVALTAQKVKVQAAEQEYRTATSALHGLNEQIATNSVASRSNTAEINRLVTERQGLTQQVAAATQKQREANAALKEAEANAKQAAAALAKQTDKVTELQARTAASRNEVAGLAAKENELKSSIGKTTDELNKHTEALRRLHSQNSNVVQMFNLFEQEGRKSLSFMQRLRGQVLQLAAAYVSLYGTIGVVQRGLAQNQTETSTKARLNVVFDGDAKKSAEELKLLRAEADRLGMSYIDLAEQYSKVAAAAKSSGASIEQIRTTFFALTEASKSLGLSTEQNEKIFTAINQIFSKGKIQAEELRGQLGDSLPAAVALLAKAMGKPTYELEKMLSQGEVTSQQIIGFALEAQKAFGGGLKDQMTSVNSEINRTLNILNDMQRSFNEGFFVGFGQALREIRDALGGTNGAAELGKTFGKALGDLTLAAVRLGHWIREFTPLITIFVAAFAAEKIISFGGALIVATTASGGLLTTISALMAELSALPGLLAASGTSAEAAAVGMRAFAAAVNSIFLVFAAGAIGYQIGKFLNNFKLVRIAAVNLVESFELARIAVGAIGTVLVNVFKLATRQISGGEFIKAIRKLRADATEEVKKVTTITDQMRADINSGADQAQAAPSQGTDYTKFLEEQKKVALEQAKINDGIEKERLARDKAAKEREKAAKKAAAEAEVTKRHQAEINQLLESSRDRIVDLAAARQRYSENIDKALIAGAEETLKSRLEEVDRQFNEYRRDADAIISDIDKQIYKLQQVMQDPKATANQRQTASFQVAQLKEESSLVAARRDQDATVAKERAADLARLDQLQQDIANKQAARQRKLDANQRQFDQGLINTYQLEEMNNQVILDTADGLKQSSDQAAILADTLGKPELAAQLAAQGDAVRDGLVLHMITANDLFNSLTANATAAAESIVDGFAKAATGAQSWGDAIRNIGGAFRSFAAGVLRDIATMIIRMLILRAISAALGVPTVPTTPAPINMPDLSLPAGQFHSGGVIGRSGYGGKSRMADPSWFASAQRFHTGGVIGLKRDEVPAILQTGEEVLSRNDPRNVMNGGSGGKAQDIKIINAIDTGSVINHGLSSREGQTAIMNFIRANKATVKQALA